MADPVTSELPENEEGRKKSRSRAAFGDEFGVASGTRFTVGIVLYYGETVTVLMHTLMLMRWR